MCGPGPRSVGFGSARPRLVGHLARVHFGYTGRRNRLIATVKCLTAGSSPAVHGGVATGTNEAEDGEDAMCSGRSPRRVAGTNSEVS
jgi:hypothetical protein